METIGKFIKRVNPKRSELGLKNTKYYDYRLDTDPIVWEVELTAHGDYSGCGVEHSNFEVLKQRYPEIVSIRRFDFGGEAIYLDPTKELREEQSVLMIELLYDLESIKKETILDDDHYNEYIMELQLEALHEWAAREVGKSTSVLGKIINDEEVLYDVAYDAWLEIDQEAIIVEESHRAYLNEEKMTKAVWLQLKQIADSQLGEV